MNLLIEPSFWAKITAVTERQTGQAYNDWRANFVGKEGCLGFRYYGKTFEFDSDDGVDDSSNEINRNRFWSGRIEAIAETDNELQITTHNSIYTFEIIKKTPNEDTSAYYAHLTS